LNHLTTVTLESAWSDPSTIRAIESNYPGFVTSFLYPVQSPDGTRLALVSQDPDVAGALSGQVFAARRNMSLPPAITQVGGQSVHDTTATVSFNVIVGQSLTFQVSATEPESDALSYHASFLRLGMTFDAPTRTFTWSNVPGPASETYNVKLWTTTPSGGTDAIIARITTLSMGPSALRQADDADLDTGPRSGVPRAVGAGFAIVTPGVGSEAHLSIFDITGRRVAVIRGRGGEELVWEGTNERGAAVQPGVYLYRVIVGPHREGGRWVVLR
jgi:hypothetical protein